MMMGLGYVTWTTITESGTYDDAEAKEVRKRVSTRDIRRNIWKVLTLMLYSAIWTHLDAFFF